jgi:hypothetical protein
MQNNSSTSAEQTKTNQPAKRTPPTPAQIAAEQKRIAESDATRRAAVLPTAPASKPVKTSTAVTIPDNRDPVQQYLDDIAPASIVGRMVKFSKEGQFAVSDDDSVIDDDVDFIALVDQTLIGYIKFNGEGAPPDRAMGLLYDGFVMPPRSSLPDLDQAKWEIGLDGRPADPWQHHVYLVLQRADTGELFTFVTSSVTGRRAIGTLLRHYDRMQRTNPDQYPVIRLKIGGFQHKDDRVGWVKVPVLAVVGRQAKDDAARPDTSPAADMNDSLPF